MDKKGRQQKGEGHRQRLRERFLERGLESLSDVEVLELLLCSHKDLPGAQSRDIIFYVISL